MSTTPLYRGPNRHYNATAAVARSRSSTAGAVIVGSFLSLSIIAGWFVQFRLQGDESIWSAVPPTGEVSVFWQILREAAVVAAIVVAVGVRFRDSIRRTGRARTPPVLPVGLLTLAVLVVYSLAVVGLPIAVVLAGLRPFVYSLLMVLLLTLTLTQRKAIGEIVDLAVRLNLIVQASAATIQLQSDSSRFGSTYFGPRPWGTYASPMLLGLCCAFSLMVLVAVRRRGWPFWVLVALVIVSTTGSRASFLAIALFVVLFTTRNLTGRVVLLPWLAAGGFALLLFVSSSGVSGREIRSEGRLALWGAVASELQTAADWLFGLGLGSGTNGGIAVAQQSGVNLEVQITDSLFVSTMVSAGLIGVCLLLIVFWAIFTKLPKSVRWSALGPIAIASLTFNLLELSPSNVLAAVFVCTIGIPHASRIDGSAAVGERAASSNESVEFRSNSQIVTPGVNGKTLRPRQTLRS